MSVTAIWDNEEQTHLRFIFDKLWQLEDLYDAILLAHDIIEEQGEVIDVILDMSDCDSMPANLSILRSHLMEFDRDHIGVLVFVTQNIYLQPVMQLLNQLMRQNFVMYFTDLLEDARRIAKRATITRQNSTIS